MAVNIGNPGEGALKKGVLFTSVAVLGAGLVAAIAVGTVAWSAGRSGALAGALGVAVAGVVLYFMRGDWAEIYDGYREGRNHLKGAKGEGLVNQALAGLSDEYVVFHDFHPVSSAGAAAKWNVDHIVIGPTGVFVVETKNYSARQIRVDDHQTRKNIAQVNRNALDLKKNIMKWTAGGLGELFVVPLLVYSQADVHVDKLRQGAARVLPLKLLINEITRHSEASIDMDKAHRLARVLFHQLSVGERAAFEDDMLRYGRAARIATNNVRKEKAAAGISAQVAENRQPPAEVIPCPLCGAPLVLRTAKKGPHVGNKFWGCSGFPVCRYTRQLVVSAED